MRMVTEISTASATAFYICSHSNQQKTIQNKRQFKQPPLVNFNYSVLMLPQLLTLSLKKRHPDFTRSAVINFDYRIRIVLSVEYSALFSVCRISADLTVDTCKSACAAYINSHVSLSKFRNCKCTVSNILNITCNSVNILTVRNVLECCT